MNVGDKFVNSDFVVFLLFDSFSIQSRFLVNFKKGFFMEDIYVME